MTGKQLKEWRVAHGLSQARLARYLGVIRETIARWETGVRAVPSFLPLALKGLEIQLKEERNERGETTS